MEEKFIAAWMQARQTAKELGVRMRPMEPSDALRQARYCLDSPRVSDGFEVLADKGRLDLTNRVQRRRVRTRLLCYF